MWSYDLLGHEVEYVLARTGTSDVLNVNDAEHRLALVRREGGWMLLRNTGDLWGDRLFSLRDQLATVRVSGPAPCVFQGARGLVCGAPERRVEPAEWRRGRSRYPCLEVALPAGTAVTFTLPALSANARILRGTLTAQRAAGMPFVPRALPGVAETPTQAVVVDLSGLGATIELPPVEAHVDRPLVPFSVGLAPGARGLTLRLRNEGPEPARGCLVATVYDR